MLSEQDIDAIAKAYAEGKITARGANKDWGGLGRRKDKG